VKSFRADSYKSANGAVVLWKLLSESPDNSVSHYYDQTFTTLQISLKSGPDKNSRLSGLQLADKKVAEVMAMYGRVVSSGKGSKFFQSDPLFIASKKMAKHYYCRVENRQKCNNRRISEIIFLQKPHYIERINYITISSVVPAQDQVTCLSTQGKELDKYFDTVDKVGQVQ